jgi:hypothetical protein
LRCECQPLLTPHSSFRFEPDKQFITDAITASQSVQSFLENSLPGRKRVYMITGLKIATGFRTSTSSSTHHGPTLSIGVSASAFGAPIETGPEIEIESTRSRTVAQGRALNKIVFAYRVVRIKRKRDGEAKYKYKSGGKYSVDDSDGEDEEGEGLWEMDVLDEGQRESEFPDTLRVDVEEGRAEGGDAVKS